MKSLYNGYSYKREVVKMRKTYYDDINATFVALTGFVGLTMVSGLVLTATKVAADDVVDDVTITVPTSCTMSGSGMTSHTSTLQNGSYTPNIGTTTMNVFCNDTNGFSIYAIGFSGDELGTEDSTKLLGTSASNDAKIATGTATSAGNPDVSNWAMKLSTDSQATYPVTLENNFDSYHAVPSEYTQVAMRDASTDVGQNATGSTITSTYAAYISRTQPADTYSGKVKYVLVHPNDGAAPVIPTASTCNTPVPNLTYMQDLNSSNKASILAGMTEDQQYFLKDKRDEKTYCVARLKDGNIWMTQNLDHDISTSYNYTNQNTDIGWNSGTNSYDTTSWAPVRATYPSSSTTWSSTDTSTSPFPYGFTAPESYDPGDLYWNGTESDYSDWNDYWNSCDWSDPDPYSTCDESLNPKSTYLSDSGESQYHLGNYYNWSAAVAMNDTSSYTTSNVDLDRSICPANWTLPRIGQANGSFYNLWNQYGFTSSSFNDVDEDNVHDEGENALWTSPLYFAASGYIGGSLGDVGYDGYFWSPVVVNEGYAGVADFGVDGYVYPENGYGRADGLSVRCVARPVTPFSGS